MYLYDLKTGQHRETFPLDVGSIGSLSGRKEDAELFYYFTSFLTPGKIFRCDMAAETLSPTVILAPHLAPRHSIVSVTVGISHPGV